VGPENCPCTMLEVARKPGPTSPVHDIPADALVIRGGICNATDLAMAAAKMRDISGVPGLSVFGAIDAPIEDLAAAIRAPYSQIRRTTARALYDRGFWISKTSGPRHYTVWVHDIEHGALEVFEQAFLPPEPFPRRSQGIKGG
jgi:hypothetical protein